MISAHCCCGKSADGSGPSLGMLAYFGFGEVQNLAFLAGHRASDVTGNFLGGGEHEAVHSNDVTAGHADAGVAKKRFDGQLA